jgi:SAM-dependent methyltransferase
MSDVHDTWAAGSAYEDFMGRWSRQLAPHFVRWLPVPDNVHWLDVGCGTGALTNAICMHASPSSVLGCDPAESFVEYARGHSPDVRASFMVARAGELPRHVDGYGCVTSSLALNFLPEPLVALREMRSIAAARGVVSACVWDYGGKMEFLRYFWDAAAAVDPRARQLDEAQRFPMCRPDALVDLFRAAELSDVRCEPIEIPTAFTSFEDYWQPFLGGTGPAPSFVASLEGDRREMLRRKLEGMLAQGSTGRTVLVARAWAVCGTAT